MSVFFFCSFPYSYHIFLVLFTCLVPSTFITNSYSLSVTKSPLQRFKGIRYAISFIYLKSRSLKEVFLEPLTLFFWSSFHVPVVHSSHLGASLHYLSLLVDLQLWQISCLHFFCSFIPLTSGTHSSILLDKEIHDLRK